MCKVARWGNLIGWFLGGLFVCLRWKPGTKEIAAALFETPRPSRRRRRSSSSRSRTLTLALTVRLKRVKLWRASSRLSQTHPDLSVALILFFFPLSHKDSSVSASLSFRSRVPPGKFGFPIQAAHCNRVVPVSKSLLHLIGFVPGP